MGALCPTVGNYNELRPRNTVAGRVGGNSETGSRQLPSRNGHGCPDLSQVVAANRRACGCAQVERNRSSVVEEH
jgi:hypothetical protein